MTASREDLVASVDLGAMAAANGVDFNIALALYKTWKSFGKSGSATVGVGREQFAEIYLRALANTANIVEGQSYHTPTSEHEAMALFDAFDTAHNGTVEFGEFLLGFVVATNGSLESKAALLFDSIDLNGDGFLSREELTTKIEKSFNSYAAVNLNAVETLNSADISFVAKWMQQQAAEKKLREIPALVDSCFLADANRDGKISREEWISASLENHSQSQQPKVNGIRRLLNELCWISN